MAMPDRLHALRRTDYDFWFPVGKCSATPGEDDNYVKCENIDKIREKIYKLRDEVPGKLVPKIDKIHDELKRVTWGHNG